jgi:hypothetical protein
MRLQIDVQIDVNDTVDQRFLSWYEQHEDKCKHLLLMGFMMVENGLVSFYDDKYKQDIEGIWLDKYNQAVSEKSRLEKVNNETLAQLESVKSVYEQTYESKLRGLTDSLTEQHMQRTKQLEMQIKSHEERIDDERRRLRAQFQEEMDVILHRLQESQQSLKTIREETKSLVQDVKFEYEDEILLLKEKHEDELSSIQNKKKRECIDITTMYEALKEKHTALEIKLESVEKKYEQSSKHRIQEGLKQKDVEIVLLKKQACQYTQQLQDVNKQLHNLQKENKEITNSKLEALQKQYNDTYVTTLKDTITKLKTELDIVKNTNAYKGSQGEQCIKDILCKQFLDCDVQDTSKKGGQSDIHLITKEGYVIAIESKNKAKITSEDVEKSYSDLKILAKQYGSKLIGYVFISHRTQNIPKKGNMHFERVDNLPLVWYGVEDSNILEKGLYVIVKMLMCEKSSTTDKDDNKSLEWTFATIKGSINMLMENTTLCSKVHDSINAMNSNLNKIVANNQQVYNELLRCLGEEPTTPVINPSTSGQFVCNTCGKVFKRKCDWTNHKKVSCKTT